MQQMRGQFVGQHRQLEVEHQLQHWQIVLHPVVGLLCGSTSLLGPTASRPLECMYHVAWMNALSSRNSINVASWLDNSVYLYTIVYTMKF